MRKITIIVLAFFCISICTSQENYKQSLDGVKRVKIYTQTNVKITVGSSNDIIIGDYKDCKDCRKNDRIINDKNKSKKLRPIYANGNDNTGYGLQVKREGDLLEILDLKSAYQRNPGLRIILPQGISISLNCGQLDGHAVIEGFSSEIDVETHVGRIDLIDVSGPITANSLAGEVNIIFNAVNQKGPTTIRTSGSNIDVTLPKNTNANIELRSDQGAVFTDFNFKPIKKDGLRAIGANRRIKSSINKGGVSIKISSHLGNIYLRKKE